MNRERTYESKLLPRRMLSSMNLLIGASSAANGPDNEPPKRYLSAVGRPLQFPEDDAVISFSSSQFVFCPIPSIAARTIGRARSSQFCVTLSQQIPVGGQSVCPGALVMGEFVGGGIRHWASLVALAIGRFTLERCSRPYGQPSRDQSIAEAIY